VDDACEHLAMTNGILALDCYIDSAPLNGATRDCGGIIARLIFDGTLIRRDREWIDRTRAFSEGENRRNVRPVRKPRCSRAPSNIRVTFERCEIKSGVMIHRLDVGAAEREPSENSRREEEDTDLFNATS